jgi:predicted ATP-dependent serine protease|nr:MAG TPA: AAA domain protein [Caudoviricetes sp.]
MSGAWVAVGVAAATAATSMYSANKQDKAQRAAADRQAKSAAEAQKQQQQEFNKANQNEVDVSGIMGQNQQGSGAATLLTGPQGVGKNNMLLGGGSSLLGG